MIPSNDDFSKAPPPTVQPIAMMAPPISIDTPGLGDKDTKPMGTFHAVMPDAIVENLGDIPPLIINLPFKE